MTDYNAMVKKARRLGCRVEHAKKHIKIYVPEGGIVIAAVSPSRHNAHLDLRSQLRRAGLSI